MSLCLLPVRARFGRFALRVSRFARALFFSCPQLVLFSWAAFPDAVTNPWKVVFFWNGPWFVVLFVLGQAGERRVLALFVTRLRASATLPSVASAVRRRERVSVLRGDVVALLRSLGRNVSGHRADLLVRDIRVVLDGQWDGQVRFVELVPELRQTAHPANARPRHSDLTRDWN